MKLFAFGSNSCGQLGIGHTYDVSRPHDVNVDLSARIKSITAAANTTWILTEDHRLYRSGIDISRKVTSVEHTRHHFAEDEISQLHEIDFAAATWEALIFVTRAGSVHVCGHGSKGELGLGDDVTFTRSENSLEKFPPDGLRVVDVACGPCHAVAVLSNGEAYGWGNGRKGQLGQPAELVWTPRKIENLPEKVRRVACGKDFTAFTKDRPTAGVIVIGSDRWGLLSATQTTVDQIRSLHTNWNSLHILQPSRVVTSLGRNDQGQLAPKRLPSIDRLQAGSEHVVAITTAGKLISWGWGEHGNCGEQTEGDSADQGNEIEIPDSKGLKVAGVGAGCATSFVWAEEARDGD